MAIWRRLRLVPFVVVIPPDERDVDLPDKLAAEYAGILAWAAQGCRDWLEYGLEAPDAVTAATAEYETESDALADFLADCCLVNDMVRVKVGDLHESYKNWAERSGERAESKRGLGLLLKERGFVAERMSTGRFWRGLALRKGD